jgi:hypothetical protein
MNDPVVMPILIRAMGCLQVEALKVTNPPANFHVRPGGSFAAFADQYRDECCEGVAWVRPALQYETDDFPAARGEASRIDPAYLAVQVELGILRCLVTQGPEGEGTVPTAQQWLDAAQNSMDDMAALRRAVCCIRDAYGTDAVIVGQYEPLDNEGNCAGNRVVVTIRAALCDCEG